MRQIEAALLGAARRVYGANADVSVEINLEASEIRCYVPKKVVNIMRDFLTEIPLDIARRLHAGAELGQTLEVEINPMELGRIPAQLARQILRQKLKEAERAKIYDEFAGREGELVTGHVQRFERRGFILDLEQTEAFFTGARGSSGVPLRAWQTVAVSHLTSAGCEPWRACRRLSQAQRPHQGVI